MEEVHSDFTSGEVTYTNSAAQPKENIVRAIEDLGYEVVEKEAASRTFSKIELKFWISLGFTIPLFLHMFVPKDSFLQNPWLQLVLCLPVFMIGLLHFGRSSIAAIKAHIANMDVLILIGTTAAFVYSLSGMLMYLGTHAMHNYLFFETTATIITLVLLGNVIEHRAVQQTTSAIKALSKLQKVIAYRILEVAGTKQIQEIESSEVVVGDKLQVNSGDRIPVDGKILDGQGHANESMLTGESMPVNKNIGDSLIGGSVLESGNIVMLASKVGDATTLAQIIRLVKDAQRKKPSIQRLGDKISAVFVPIVIAIALCTFLIVFFFTDLGLQTAIMNSIAVLVISCPCAMGLATPTAVAAGLGRAAKNGIIIKGGSTLETLAKIKHIVFDKTGTLTTGDFELTTLQTFAGAEEAEVRNITLSLEQYSSHPIARSLVKTLKGSANLVPLVEVEEEKGHGMRGKDMAGNQYHLGASRWLDKSGGNEASILLTRNGEKIASFNIEDQLKPRAKETMAFFSARNIAPTLLSGDRKGKCEELGNTLGIPHVLGEQLPKHKLEEIGRLMASGPTAMVGDGINDAPALTKADIGISLSNASQVAVQSASVIIMKGEDLTKIADAYLISSHTLKTIKQNLFWALFYNILAIPIAAMGLLNPMIAALAMAFSDIVVIGNSIRLKTKNIGQLRSIHSKSVGH